MNKNNILFRYDKDLRIHNMYPEARREVSKDIVRFVRQAPGMNFVGFTFANEVDLDNVIAQQLEYFAPFQQPLTWKVYEHDLLHTLETKLTDHGFIADDDPGDVMVLAVDQMPARLNLPTAADIRRVSTPDRLKDIVTVLDAVYGNHNAWVYERLGLHLQVPGYLSAYVAYVEHQPAAVAWTYFPKGHFATLYGGSTIVEYRNHGLYTSLLAIRLQEICRRGYPFAVVEAGPMSKPIAAKHGFQHLTTVWDYERSKVAVTSGVSEKEDVNVV